MAKEVKSWERQDGETAKQFEAFVEYRDMNEDRSLSAVAQKLNKSKQLLGRWSAANNWVERCTAWDNERDRLARLEQIKEIKQMRKDHAKVARNMMKIANKGLLKMMDKQGNLIAPLNANEISRLAEVGSKLERISLGDVGDVVEERQGEAVADPVQFYMPDNGRDNVDEGAK